MPILLDPSRDIDFVETPPDDVYCPITLGVSFYPHQTSCCGKHLSEEAVVKIQDQGKACPLCREANWSTMQSLYFQHTIHGLQVYCFHKSRGCWWKGELRSLFSHELSCAYNYTKTHSQVSKEEQVHFMPVIYSTHVFVTTLHP